VLPPLQHRQPIFNVPSVVLWLLGTFFAVHLVRMALSPDEELRFTVALAFIPARLGAHAADLPGGKVAVFTAFITHMFLHGDVTHLLINSAWLLAFGSPVARRIGALRFLCFFLLTGMIGALVYLLVNGAVLVPMVGASGAISGLMGAAFRFLFRGLASAGSDASGMRGVPLMSLGEALRDRRVLVAAAVWTVLNGLQAWGGGIVTEAAGIAWEAHLGGFYSGLLLYGLFEPVPPDAAGNAAPAC
jgi:membrane associated rhomboid family serine protease